MDENDSGDTIDIVATATPPSAYAKAKKTFWFVFRIAVAAGIIAAMVMLLPAQKRVELFESIRNIDIGWLALAAALFMLHEFMAAFRWYLLMRSQGIKISLWEAFSLTMQSIFFSMVIPGGAIGGDLVKAGFVTARIAKGGRLEGVFSILMDRVFGLLGLFTVAALACCLGWRLLQAAPYDARLIAVILGGCCLGGLGGAIFLFTHRFFEMIPPVRRLIGFADTLSKGAVSRLIGALDLYKKSPWTLLACLAVSAVGVHLNLVAVAICLGKGLGIAEISGKAFLLGVSLANVAAAIPVTPSGIGARDFVMMSILMTGGYDKAMSTAIPIVFTAIVVCANLLGGLFFIFGGRGRKP